MNNDIKYRDITVASSVRQHEGSHVGDDILLFDDITSVLIGKDPRRMQSLFLAMCVKGHASYFVDSVAHTVGPGDIISVSKGRVTYDYTLSPDCQAIGILIDYDFFKDTIKSVHELSALFLFARNHPVFHLPDDKAEEITDIFFRMKRKIDAADNHFLREMVQSMFLTLVYEMCDEIYKVQTHSPTHNTRAEEIFTTFLTLVESHFREERRVGWYSEQLCISPKYLSETVKAVSKRTPNEWIDSYVIMELCMLLRSSQRSIKEIAQSLNFSNQSFLGKYFKEHMGVSPSDYRNGASPRPRGKERLGDGA